MDCTFFSVFFDIDCTNSSVFREVDCTFSTILKESDCPGKPKKKKLIYQRCLPPETKKDYGVGLQEDEVWILRNHQNS